MMSDDGSDRFDHVVFPHRHLRRARLAIFIAILDLTGDLRALDQILYLHRTRSTFI